MAKKKPTVPRSIALPVARAWDDNGAVPSERLEDALAQAWTLSTDLANWCAVQCLAVELEAGAVSAPGPTPAPPYATYTRLITGQAPLSERWAGLTQTAACVCRRVEGAFGRHRRAVLWDRTECVIHFRYPYPWPVHQRAWKALYRDGRPCVSLALPGAGRLVLELRGGPEFRPHLAHFRALAEGKAKQRELLLCRQRTSAGNVRLTMQEHGPAGAPQTYYRVMVRIAVDRTVGRNGRARAAMLVATGEDCLWRATCNNHPDWRYNGDHALRWLAEHREYLQRMGEDTKPEKRLPRPKRRQLNGARDKRCLKHRRRMRSFCDMAAAMLANHARRCNVARLIYDDSCKQFLGDAAPWAALKKEVKEKLEEYGIAFVAASAAKVAETAAGARKG